MKLHYLKVVLLLIAVVGCSRRARVWGEVSYNDQPLERGTITFMPIEGTPGPSTGAGIDKGRYDIPAKKGPLKGGTYQVQILGLTKSGRKVPNPLDPGGAVVDEYVEIVPRGKVQQTTRKVTLPQNQADNEFNFTVEKGRP